MQLRGPVSELRSAAGGCPRSLCRDSLRQSPLEGVQKASSPPQSVADHLEEELDMLLHLDAPVKEEDNSSPDQTFQDQEPERDEQVAQEETGMAFISFPTHLLKTYPSVSDIDPTMSQVSLPMANHSFL